MLPDLDYNEEARKLWSRLGDGPIMNYSIIFGSIISVFGDFPRIS
jgi:hypothetical protein